MKSLRFLVGLVLLGLAGCLGGGKVDPLPVGHIVPMSGPHEFAGERSRQAILLALEDLNNPEKRGGKRPILVQHADSRRGAATALRFIKVDRVLALLDSSDPAQTSGIAAAAAGGETPVVTINPWSPPPPNGFVFSLTAGPAYQGKLLARFAREELKLDSLLVWSDSRVPACAVMADAFNKEWLKLGGRTIAGPLTFDPDKDLKEQADQIKKAKPPGVVFLGAAERILQVESLLQQASLSVPLLFAGDEGARVVLSGMSPPGKMYLLTALAAEGLTPVGQETARVYRERFGVELEAPAGLTFDGIRLLTEALRKAKSPGAGLAKELQGVEDFESLTGPLSFAPEGWARRPVFVVAVEGSEAKLAKSYEAEPK